MFVFCPYFRFAMIAEQNDWTSSQVWILHVCWMRRLTSWRDDSAVAPARVHLTTPQPTGSSGDDQSVCWQLCSHNCCLWRVICGIKWSMAAFPVTYSDNMSGMNIWVLRVLIWRASVGYWARFVWRCVFISDGPGQPYSQIPTELRLCFVSADDLFPHSSPTWLAHQAGQWLVAVYTAITHNPLSMSCN